MAKEKLVDLAPKAEKITDEQLEPYKVSFS